MTKLSLTHFCCCSPFLPLAYRSYIKPLKSCAPAAINFAPLNPEPRLLATISENLFLASIPLVSWIIVFISVSNLTGSGNDGFKLGFLAKASLPFFKVFSFFVSAFWFTSNCGIVFWNCCNSIFTLFPISCSQIKFCCKAITLALLCKFWGTWTLYLAVKICPKKLKLFGLKPPLFAFTLGWKYFAKIGTIFDLSPVFINSSKPFWTSGGILESKL